MIWFLVELILDVALYFPQEVLASLFPDSESGNRPRRKRLAREGDVKGRAVFVVSLVCWLTLIVAVGFVIWHFARHERVDFRAVRW